MANNHGVWPGWEIGPTLGKGGFGRVVEIHRQIPGNVEKAALKIISIPGSEDEIVQMRSDGYDEESITAHFREHKEEILREYVLMSQMRGCANVVYCDDFRAIQHDNGIGWDIYIKMELLTPLMKHLDGSVSEAQVRRLGMDIGNALSYCYRHNIIHRDIKPANMFAAPDGSFKLGDFGIARTLERTSGATRIGTEGYMAPEIFRGQPYGSRADIYSLGLVLYELMNGFRRPFEPPHDQPLTVRIREEARIRRFRGEPLPPPAYGSPELQQIVLKACAYDPRDRFQSPDELISALANPMAFAQSQSQPVRHQAVEKTVPVEEPVVRSAPPAVHPRKKSSASPVILGIAVGVMLIALLSFLIPELLDHDRKQRPTVQNAASTSQTEPSGTEPPETEPPETEAPTEPAPRVLRNVIGGGREHTVVLQSDGTVIATGLGDQGQTNVSGWRNVISVSAGDYHSVGLCADGSVLVAGYNYDGQINVTGWSDMIAVSAGDYHTVGLRADGTVLATGRSTDGQCNTAELMRLAGSRRIVDVAAGFRHTAALLEDGTVIAVGNNQYGQCNVFSWDGIVELHAATDHTVGLRADGTVVATGYNVDGRCNVDSWQNIVTITAGDDFTMGLLPDGTVIATGRNLENQISVGHWKNIIAIGGGSNHSIGLCADGTIVAVGRNNNRQCDLFFWS